MLRKQFLLYNRLCRIIIVHTFCRQSCYTLPSTPNVQIQARVKDLFLGKTTFLWHSRKIDGFLDHLYFTTVQHYVMGGKY